MIACSNEENLLNIGFKGYIVSIYVKNCCVRISSCFSEFIYLFAGKCRTDFSPTTIVNCRKDYNDQFLNLYYA